MNKYGIYLISDPKYGFDKVEDALKTGKVKFFQYRNKEADDQSFVNEAKKYAELCNKYNTKLIINDRVHLLGQIEVNGIHVGQSDMPVVACKQLYPSYLVGVSAHTIEEVNQAIADGADYVGVGAMFATQTKLDASAVSIETLKQIRKQCNVDIVTIGGITVGNSLELVDYCDGLAVCSDILNSKHPGKMVEQYFKNLKH